MFTLYLFTGLSHSAKQGFWHDEMYTLTFLKGFSIYDFEGSFWSRQDTLYDVNYFKTQFEQDNFYSNFPTQILHEGHPPLYFVLLKLWSYIFGSSELGLRSFSLCCGLLSFLVFFTLFRTKSTNKYTAWGVLLMLIFNPFLFYFFTEARMYALSFLLAALSFRYWLCFQENKKVKSKEFLYFCLSAIALLYTHYYGLFFLSSLAFIELLRVGFKRSIFNYSLPLLFFLPWGLAIRKQLSFHEVHWTDVVISFGDSLMGYFNGISHLLISPMVSPLLYEQIILSVILVTLIAFLFFRECKFTLILISTILMYGLQIYIFDQLVEHHSILVPRYYIFSLVFIYWGIYKLLEGPDKIPSMVISITYTVLTSAIIFQLYNLDRAPKQMFREVAGFIDGQLDSKTRILVFEPRGALMVGVAYYLENNFKLVSADNFSDDIGLSAVYIDEMLGVANRENKYHGKEQEKLELIPFVGVFLYK
ncbi:glycosyltransferase family 39 protein [Flavobacteriaceae bacterium]|nr:glycosyltransferase family 39 protein [Flavobacteriaceae bacterium]